MTIVLFIVGIPLLILGAEALVRGAARISFAAGISPLIVGLTVVSFATSSPELAVSIGASLGGEADIALGNVVGSNIFNILVILGVSAAITPLVVSSQLVRLDAPLLVVASVLVFLLALDDRIGRVDGLILFGGLVFYITFLAWKGMRDSGAPTVGPPPTGGRRTYSAKLLLTDVTYIGVGVAMLVIGARWLVDGAVQIASAIGVSELVIGLTIVSAGTSLPEVATSVLASLRGQTDIAVGNVIGSNLFNILGVLGLTGILAPGGISVPDAVLNFDLPVMTAVAVASLPVFFTGNVIARWEGWVFLGYYAAFMAYVIMRATEHDLLPAFSAVMLEFVVPITVLTLAILVVRAYRSGRSANRQDGGTSRPD